MTDWINGWIPERKRQDYYDRINPGAGFGPFAFIGQGFKYYLGDGSSRQKATPESEARWAAYLGLPYDKSKAPDTKIRFEHDKDYPDRQYQGLSEDAKNEIRERIIPVLEDNELKEGWTQVIGDNNPIKRKAKFTKDKTVIYPRQDHTDDLESFGIREVGNSGIYEVGDKYDFPWYVPIPDRPEGRELMIRDTIWSPRANPKEYKKLVKKRQ